MVDGATVKVDMSGWNELFDRLAGPLRVSLARSMAVAGGQVVRDEAKLRASRDNTGKLARAIYLAFRDSRSDDNLVQYSVTWNKAKAPHGHLPEFGYWQPFVVVKIGDTWVTTDRRLTEPKWIPAQPFLRPAFEASKGRVLQAMITRGRQRLPELLGGGAVAAPQQRANAPARSVPGAAINLLRD